MPSTTTVAPALQPDSESQREKSLAEEDLEIPWEPDQPTKLVVDVPQIVADSVRVEITAWHGESGGLAEVEVLDKAGKNLAAGALVFDQRRAPPGRPAQWSHPDRWKHRFPN